jgi:mono/diheme cytochrome c family protein
VFKTSCVQCHGQDGKGKPGRELFPDIPDFTLPRWQTSRADEELNRSIVSGKDSMPAMKAKLEKVDSKEMVRLIRTFRGGGRVVGGETRRPRSGSDDSKKASPPDAEQQAGSPTPAAGAPFARSTDHRPRPAPAPAAATAPRGSVAATTASGPAEGLFRANCLKCHGPDGRGAVARSTMPEIPDFATPAWQQNRDDARLAAEILDGKGAFMPAWRGRLSGEQVQELVGYVRAFGPGGSSAGKTATAEFESRYERLRKQFEDLRKESESLTHPRRALNNPSSSRIQGSLSKRG